MSKVKPSEFGGHEGRSGVAKKPADALSAAEKLRLGYTTGVEDADAPLDRNAWLGNQPEIKQ